MSLILAVEPNRHRAAQLQAMARAHLDAEFVLAASVAQAFQSIGERVPDLLLMDPLLPPAEETALDDYLRLIGPAASHLTSLRIPVLAEGGPGGARSLLAKIRREGPRHADADGCEPMVFAEQISQYLRDARSRPAPAVRPATLAEQFDRAGEGGPVLDLSSLLEEVAEVEPGPPAAAEPLAAWDSEPEIVTLGEFEPEPETIAPLELLPEPEAAAPLEVLAEPEATAPLELLPEPEAVAPLEFEPQRSADIEPPWPPAPEQEPQPIAAREPDPPQEFAPLEPVQVPLAPLALAERPAPMSAPRQQLVPIAAAPPPVAAPQVLPATVQHIVDVPTGNGTQVQAAVNVNVAVSVQVAAAVNVVATTPPRKRKPRPIQDEWGFFDPGQCGFQALMARLDEIAAKEDDEA